MSRYNKEKARFIKNLREFIKSISKHLQDNEKQWSIKGFIDIYKDIYTISSDTKVISKIIELQLLPKLLLFAEENNYKIILAEHQNWYPDMTFVNKKNSNIKFAVDIKTTYRLPKYPDHCNGFTLGSYGKYFIDRTSKKNIQFPYNEYSAHICIGVIYTRTKELSNISVYRVQEFGKKSQSNKGVKKVKALQFIPSVIENLQLFVREKWEIASDSPGSGNTKNIGSITKIDDILHGRGVFKNLGEEWFDEYWMNYKKIKVKTDKGTIKFITSLPEYLKYRGIDPKLAYPKAKKTKGKNK